MKKQSAFSLVEISVVLLILGILISGVTLGSKMVRKSKLVNAQLITTNSKIEQIPNMILWYETTLPGSVIGASNVKQPADGDAIATWKDLNPSNILNSATQSTSANQPTYKIDGINGTPALKFDGTNDYFSITNIMADNFTYFVVLRTASTGGGNISSNAYDGMGILWSDVAGASDYDEIPLAIAGGYAKMACSASNTSFTAGPVNDNKAHVIVGIRIKGTGTTVLYVDGYYNVGGLPSIYTGTLNANPNLIIGGNILGSAYFNGYIGELIIYDRNLRWDERKVVEKYLGKKWGVSISSS